MEEITISNGHENKTVATIPIIQDGCHRPVVLHTVLYSVIRPDAVAY